MNKALGSFLWLLCDAFKSYGWAILAFGLLVKLIMLPFQMKSKKSMMKTAMLAPRLKVLQKRYANNQQKQQEEISKLYKEAKVNPMSGCLWTLIPFPILIILYKIVRMPLTYVMGLAEDQISTLTDTLVRLGYYTVPEKVDAYAEMTIANAVHQHFDELISNSALADMALKDINFRFLSMDLATKPKLMFWRDTDFSSAAIWVPVVIAFLIPFISAALTVLQTKLSQKMNPPEDAKTAQTTKTMNTVMPLTSVYICFIMPVAMGLYWIEQSVLGIVQEAILNKYYKGKIDLEMAEFNEAQRLKDEELERKRLETERKKAEGSTSVNVHTSKKRLASQEKNARDQREAAQRRAEKEARGGIKEIPDSQVDNRVYARGRAYVKDRYAHEAAETAADEPSAEEEVIASDIIESVAEAAETNASVEEVAAEEAAAEAYTAAEQEE